MTVGGVSASYRCRLAEERDDLPLGELLVDAFFRTYAKRMPEVVLSVGRLKELRDTSSRRIQSWVLIMEEFLPNLAPRLVGSVTLMPPGTPGSRAWRPGYADAKMLVICPELQTHGLGTVLIQEAIHMLRSRGVEGVSIHVRQGALGLARAYEAVGFTRATEGDVDLRPEIFLEAYVLGLRSEED